MPSLTDRTSSAEYADMLTAAQSPHVAAAIAEMRLRLEAMLKEQKALLVENKVLCDEDKRAAEVSGDGLARIVKATATHDKQCFVDFSERLKTLPAAMLDKVPYPARNHKMDLVIQGAADRIFQADETNICRLANGDLPLSWTQAYNPESLPILGGDSVFWGSSNVTFLSYGILAVKFALSGRTIQDIPLDSAITHVTPLPAGVSLNPGCSFAWSKDKLDGLGYVHGGYSFGGHRFEEILYPHGKQFGPEDCSSWMAKLTHCPTLFSTIDQLYTFRATTREPNAHTAVPATWRQSRDAKAMLAKYTAVDIADAQVGDIYVSRTFAQAQNPETDAGNGGHTALIFSIDRERKVAATLGFSRDMPKSEGFGIQLFPLEQTRTAAGLKQPYVLRCG